MTPPAAGGRRLSVVVIACDEEASIAAVVRELLEELARATDEHEVVVVDDGSRDATAARVAELAAADPRVRLVRHDRNRGGGAAVRTGIAAARLPLVLYVPGDGQFETSELGRYLGGTGGADIVLGVRTNRTGGWRRRAASAAYRAVVRGLFRLRCRDLNWCKLYRREAFLALAPRAASWFLDTEVLARARRAGLVLREVEVSERPRRGGRASGGRPSAMLATARELLLLARELRSPSGAGG